MAEIYCRGMTKTEYNKWYHDTHKEERNLKSRKWREKASIERPFRKREAAYGISGKDIVALYESQKGLCAICKTPIDLAGKLSTIDHDHETREVRGFLCSACNAGLGMFKDDPFILRAAERYIHKWM